MRSEWIEFEYLNPETDEQAKQDLMDVYDGKVTFPSLHKGGEHLKHPKIPELRKFMGEQ